jgi:hypothetical protein
MMDAFEFYYSNLSIKGRSIEVSEVSDTHK